MAFLDLHVSLAGLAVGLIVGLTGMGGGALMTPVLVLLFGVAPTAAVASDLVASLFMKPLGVLIHLRRGTVQRPIVRYLLLGSVPSAFVGAALINHVGASGAVNGALKALLGVALLVASGAQFAKALLRTRRDGPPGTSQAPFAVKPLPTIAIGVFGGLIVGMTSVGSGSLIVVMLMLLYPQLSGSLLVGTDLAQAVPLVGAAALGHVVFGHVSLPLTLSLIAGGIPGVCLGAYGSARAPDRVIRPVLVLVLAASALKLLGAPNHVIGAVAGTLGGIGIIWALTEGRLSAPSGNDAVEAKSAAQIGGE